MSKIEDHFSSTYLKNANAEWKNIVVLNLIRTNLNFRAIALPGGSLNISNARREDAGMYKVKASNDEGKTIYKFKLDVHYQPK